jgi:lipoyl(octanoyl) transferase
MDLEPFSRINPCGYPGLPVTQLSDHVPSLDWNKVELQLIEQLQQQLDYAEYQFAAE